MRDREGRRERMREREGRRERVAHCKLQKAKDLTFGWLILIFKCVFQILLQCPLRRQTRRKVVSPPSPSVQLPALNYHPFYALDHGAVRFIRVVKVYY